jgi:hypothetical protein
MLLLVVHAPEAALSSMNQIIPVIVMFTVPTSLPALLLMV